MSGQNSAAAPNAGELIARAQAGDRQALEEVLASVAPAIHRFGLRMCKNQHDADDVLQDALIEVAQHLTAFEGRSSLTSWAFAVTRSACVRKRRGLKNRPPVSDEHLENEPDLAPTPEMRALGAELAQQVSKALDALPEEHREVLVLRDIEGLTALETAEAVGISVEAVKSRLHRARTALRAILQPLFEPKPFARGATCPDVSTLWSQKLEGDLSPRDCASMERHISTCSSCGAACDALKKALLACQTVRTPEVPEEIRHRIKIALRALEPGRT